MTAMIHDRTPRPEDHRRMVIFFVCAAIIMTLSYVFITKPHMAAARAAAQKQQMTAMPAVASDVGGLVSRDVALDKTARASMETSKIIGSVPLRGLRFDDVMLRDYFTTLDKTDRVMLLSPRDTQAASYVEIGLLPADRSVRTPTQDTRWRVVSGKKLSPETPVILEWDNGNDVTFRRTVSVDRRYVVTVSDDISNASEMDIMFYPYALVSEIHDKQDKDKKIAFEDQDTGVQHTGPIGYFNQSLEEISYDNLADDGSAEFPQATGWMGLTHKYWLKALLPRAEAVFDARFSYIKNATGQNIYQADMRLAPITARAGGGAKTDMRFFIGAKKLSILDDYEEQLGIKKLELAIDFGMLYVLTKPLYHVLSYIGNYLHNEYALDISFGLALLILTVLVRTLTFPLQNKSYRAMNKMKDLAPKMEELKEKFGADKIKFQEEVLALYKREKVNPASGCLPILLQIPIFFALYKVIYITLDMRHAPFWGWIHDLSAPDPTSFVNLFGLLPYDAPSFLAVGAWPLLYGFTMWVQQELNPKPEDAMQRQIFAMLPWVFTFVFAQFPAGLVIYYTWSNILGIIQQYSLRKLNPGMAPPKPNKKKHKKA
jgi:YidC/Oxa1 family membrane protein insertase